MIYTVIPLGYMQYIDGLLAKFENFSTSFLQEVFDFLEPINWKIVILVPLEAETPQTFNAFPHFMRNTTCKAKPFLVQRRRDVAYEFS